MRFYQHRVDQVVVKAGVFPLNRMGRIDEIHAVPHQRHNPSPESHRDRRTTGGKPSPASPTRQASHNQPVLDQDTKSQPDDSGDTKTKGKDRECHTLIVSAGRSQSLGKVKVCLRLNFARVDPLANRQGIVCAFGNGRHRSAFCLPEHSWCPTRPKESGPHETALSISAAAVCRFAALTASGKTAYCTKASRILR